MDSTATGRLTRASIPGAPDRMMSTVLRPAMHIVGSDSTAAGAINDYWWGTGIAEPLPPVEIPLCWLSNPVRLRLNKPLNQATVSQAAGAVGYSINRASASAYTINPFSANLESAVAGDAQSLADFVTAYRAEPRVSSPTLVIDLLYRTESERRRILGVTAGRRIQLTGTPDEFPEGAGSLVVAGVHNAIGVSVRQVTWTTSPVIGVEPGTPGPWFYLDSSRPDSTDIVPF